MKFRKGCPHHNGRARARGHSDRRLPLIVGRRLGLATADYEKGEGQSGKKRGRGNHRNGAAKIWPTLQHVDTRPHGRWKQRLIPSNCSWCNVLPDPQLNTPRWPSMSREKHVVRAPLVAAGNPRSVLDFVTISAPQVTQSQRWRCSNPLATWGWCPSEVPAPD